MNVVFILLVLFFLGVIIIIDINLFVWIKIGLFDFILIFIKLF